MLALEGALPLALGPWSGLWTDTRVRRGALAGTLLAQGVLLAVATAAVLLHPDARGDVGAASDALRGLALSACVGHLVGYLRRSRGEPSPTVPEASGGPAFGAAVAVCGAAFLEVSSAKLAVARGLDADAGLAPVLLPELAWWSGAASWAFLWLWVTPRRARAPLALSLAATAGVYAALSVADAVATLRNGVRFSPATLLLVATNLREYGGVVGSGLSAGAVAALAACLLLPVAAWRVLYPRLASARPTRRVLGLAAVTAFTLPWSGGDARAPAGLGPPLAAWLTRERALEADPGPDSAPPVSPDEVAPLALTPRSDARAPNLVVVFLESTRLSATTLGDPSLATTPTLARLGREGLSVPEMRVSVPHTTKAIVTTLCGLPAAPTTDIVEALDGALRGRCLPELLGRAGFASLMVTNADPAFEAANRYALNAGFDRIVGWGDLAGPDNPPVGYYGGRDRAMLGPALEWLDRQGDRPTLLTLVTVGSHHDYQLPPDYVPRLFAPGPENWQRYLNAVSVVDAFLGELVDAYVARGLADRTLFVVLGDHGEAFAEHGIWNHDEVVYEEGLRIPTVLWGGALGGRTGRIEGARQQFDLLPTVLSVLGFDVTGRTDGASLLGPAPERAQLASCWPATACGARIDAAGRKYVDWRGVTDDRVFDLPVDPSESRSVPVDPDARADARREIRGWQAHATARVVATAAGAQAASLSAPSSHAPSDLGDGVRLERCDAPPEALGGETVFVRCVLRLPAGLRPPLHLAWQVGAEAGGNRLLDALPASAFEQEQAYEARFPVRVPRGGGELLLGSTRARTGLMLARPGE